MSCCYVLEVVYERQESAPLKESSERIAAIDLGLNNLATLTSNQPEFQPILINGRPLKSLNQFFNKRRTALQKKLEGKNSKSSRLTRLTHSRNQKVNDYLHKVSKFLVLELLKSKIDTLVIGYNSGWKRECNLGKRNNQNFVNIPHGKLIKMLTYKCNLVGIKVVITEESYTSRASFIDQDFIPIYGEETESRTSFSGQRICRGLYRSRSGQIINADVNASYNILRKAFPEAFGYGIGSCVVQPRLVTPTKVKTKGEAAMSPKAA
jgi:putative transposase